MNRAIRQHLITLVSFACEQHHIAWTSTLQSDANRRSPVRLRHLRSIEAAQAHHRVVHNRQRILRARIVGRQHYEIAQLEDSLRALQLLAAEGRESWGGDVVAVTG